MKSSSKNKPENCIFRVPCFVGKYVDILWTSMNLKMGKHFVVRNFTYIRHLDLLERCTLGLGNDLLFNAIWRAFEYSIFLFGVKKNTLLRRTNEFIFIWNSSRWDFARDLVKQHGIQKSESEIYLFFKSRDDYVGTQCCATFAKEKLNQEKLNEIFT